MCAKVTGPLYSMGASGKIANAMVFFPWKGLNVVREWVRPANPQTGDQGDNRLILGGTGRAASAVKKESPYHQLLASMELIPGGQTKQSFIVKKIIDSFLYSVAKFESEVAAYTGHTAKASFDSNAATLGLGEFTIAYKSTTDVFSGGFMLYLLARLAISLQFAEAPYTTALASWTATEISAMVADLAAPVAA